LVDLHVYIRQRDVCDDEQVQIPEGGEFQTEGQWRWNCGMQRLCGPEGPTTDWCRRSIENVQGYIIYYC